MKWKIIFLNSYLLIFSNWINKFIRVSYKKIDITFNFIANQLILLKETDKIIQKPILKKQRY